MTHLADTLWITHPTRGTAASRHSKEDPMKRSTIAVTAAALMLLALSGCSATTAGEAPVKETSAVPKVDPGPVELTAEEAGERYLSIVCPNNIANEAIIAAYAVGEADYFSGGSPDPAAVKAAAATLAELNRAAVEHFDDEYFIWPAEVADQIPHIRTTYMGQLTMNQAVANAETYESAYTSPLPDLTPEAETAGQEIRYQLDLPSDTKASCVGHENGLTELTDERTEREAALAKQD